MASIINASTTSTAGLVQTADASGVLQLQTNGVTGLTVEANAAVTMGSNLFVSGSTVQPLVVRTAQSITGSTNIDFGSIPSWVERITIVVQGMSTNGTSPPIIRLGTSSGYVTSGYLSSGTAYGGSSNGSGVQYTNGFGFGGTVATSSTISGIMTLVNISGTTWVSSCSIAYIDAAYSGTAGGHVVAGGLVNSLRLTTVNGTDTFDAGSINILYE